MAFNYKTKEGTSRLPTSEQNQNFLQTLQNDRDKLNEAFFNAQQKWNFYHLIYQLDQFYHVGTNMVKPSLEKAKKEAKIKEELPKSWYEQLKEKESQLSAEEKQKTSAQRQSEFKAWQIEHSWYKKLKEQEINLPAEVKVKTAAQRREEFKDWQIEYNQKNASGIDRKAFFRNWRTANPRYYESDFNKI